VRFPAEILLVPSIACTTCWLPPTLPRMPARGQTIKPAKNRPGVSGSVPAQNERGKAGLVCVFLVIIVWVVFGQTLWHGFINYDDEQYVTENAHVLNGLNWADFKWALTTGHTGYSHPVTWLSIQIDAQLYGTWAGGHHLTSVIIHTINTLLLFWLFWWMTGALWASGFVAALFAVHPLHVESVAWVAERKDVLSGLFFFLTLHAYVKATLGPGEYKQVTATIRGTDPAAREVWVKGHDNYRNSGGLNNLTGVGAVIETARTLNTLVSMATTAGMRVSGQ